MNQAEFEDILAQGTEGESCRQMGLDCPELTYHAVLLLAARYLQPGEGTDSVQSIPLDWSTWEMEDGHAHGPLPKHWQVMGKGLLLNYFKWNKPNMPQRKPRTPQES